MRADLAAWLMDGADLLAERIERARPREAAAGDGGGGGGGVRRVRVANTVEALAEFLRLRPGQAMGG